MRIPRLSARAALGVALLLPALIAGYQRLAGATQSEAMLMYLRDETKPVQRIWGGTSFGAETLATELTGSESDVQWMRVVAAPPDSPRPGERVMVQLDLSGRLWAQVYDPGAGTWGDAVTLQTGLQTTPGLNTQPFDVDYDWSGSTVVVLHSNASAAGTQTALWASWNGPVSGGGNGWTTDRVVGVVTNSNNQSVRWVRLRGRPRPGSKEVAALVADGAGEVYGLYFNGNTWASTLLTNGAIAANTIETVANGRAFDLAFASSSGVGYAVLAPVNSGAGGIHDMVTLSLVGAWAAGTDTPDLENNGNNDTNWIFLGGDPAPGANNVALLRVDQGNDVSLSVWNGGAWADTLQDSAVELGLQSNNRNIADVTFEGTSSRAMAVYAEAGVATPKYRTWTVGGGWSGENAASTIDNGNGATSVVVTQQLYRAPGSDDLILAATNNFGNLMVQRWNATGSSWDVSATQVAAYLNAGTGNLPTRMGYSMDDDTLVYERNDQNPPYKIWNTVSWDSGNNPSQDVGGAPYHIVLRASPTRDEKLAVVVDNNGDVNSMQFDGATWTSPVEHATALDVGARLNVHRAADVAYETVSGDALLVYSNGSATPQYRTKADGSASWSAAAPIPSWPGSAAPVFVRVEASPSKSSNTVLVVVQDVNRKLHAAYWNGTAWSDQLTLNTAASFGGIAQGGTGESYSRAFDVAWTSGGARGLVVWGVTTPATQNTPIYRYWDPVTESWGAESIALDLDTGTISERPRWLRLTSDPASQFIALGVADSDSDLAAMTWNGATDTWGDLLINAEGALTQILNGYSPFDITYERAGGQLVLTYADGNQNIRYRVLTGGVWGGEVATADNTGSAIRSIESISNPNDPASDEMLIAVTNNNRQIRVYRWNGASFDAAYQPTLYTGWTWNNNPHAGQFFGMAYTRDFTPPTAVIETPENGRHYASLATLTGTATDGTGNNVSETARVEVEIQDLSNNQYYRVGTGWQAGQFWNTASGANPWQVTGLGAIWTTTRDYRVRVRAVDNAGNVQGTPTTSDFVFDTQNPTGVVTLPANLNAATFDGYYRGFQLATLQGTAGDIAPGAVGNLNFQLRRIIGGTTEYWNRGSETWGGSVVYFSTVSCGLTCWNSGTGVWRSTFPAAAWTDGATYYFSLQVADRAGNWRVGGTTNAFVVDETTPVVNIGLPSVNEGVYRGFQNVSGASVDSFPVRVSSVSLRDLGTNNCWGGAAFDQGCPFWINATGGNTWTYPFASTVFNNARIALSAIAQDAAGNLTLVSTDRTFRVDNTTPTAGAAVPIGLSTRTTLTSISGTATDNSNGFLEGVRLRIYRHKDNLYWNGASWGAVATAINALDTRDGNTTFADPAETFSQGWSVSFNDVDWAANASGGPVPWTADEISGSSFSLRITARDRARRRQRPAPSRVQLQRPAHQLAYLLLGRRQTHQRHRLAHSLEHARPRRDRLPRRLLRQTQRRQPRRVPDSASVRRVVLAGRRGLGRPAGQLARRVRPSDLLDLHESGVLRGRLGHLLRLVQPLLRQRRRHRRHRLRQREQAVERRDGFRGGRELRDLQRGRGQPAFGRHHAQPEPDQPPSHHLGHRRRLLRDLPRRSGHREQPRRLLRRRLARAWLPLVFELPG